MSFMTFHVAGILKSLWRNMRSADTMGHDVTKCKKKKTRGIRARNYRKETSTKGGAQHES